MGYSAELEKILKASGASEGCRLSLKANGNEYVGVLMPHHQFSAEDVVVLKLKSGYNVGIRIDSKSKIQVLEKPVERKEHASDVEEKKGLPTLVLLGTGGTIASYVDYRTGAVHPALSTSDMVNAVPEIKEIANVKAKVLFSIFSENMSPEYWVKIAEAVQEEINNGADGIIIPHGTDTMGYSAAAVSFMLQNISKPVVFVGAQRSSDRPSSDASTNLMACARFCVNAKKAGVFVLMHDTSSDDSFALHYGTRVRKMHTSRRDAFKSINCQPAAHIDSDGKMELDENLKPVSKSKVEAKTKLENKTVLLQFYPGMDPKLFEKVITESKGVVFAGSGLGHVNENMIPVIKKAVKNGTVVVMTSQCIHGQTNMNVYNTGRDLIKAGVISVYDMLPETAYVKLMWVLANSKSTDEAKKLMVTPLVGEMSERRSFYD